MVSILVVVDGSPQHGTRAPASRAGPCFNPCCRGWVTATRDGIGDNQGVGGVSILVVVDGSPQPPARSSRETTCISFNPCCRGWVTATCPGIAGTARPAWVSILVVVDGSPQQGHSRWLTKCLSRFQSLLSWMGHRNIPTPVVAVDPAFVFQSLLSWMGHRNTRMTRSRPSRPTCFNPCCRGWVTATGRPPATPNDIAVWFQSLLSWMGHRNYDRRPLQWHDMQSFNPCCRGWVTATPGTIFAAIDRPPGFNPCCRGWVTATPTRRGARRLRRDVSILVVVDGSPQPRDARDG